MVQKSKGGRKHKSVKKGKVMKQQIPYHRKTNYKVNKREYVECNICYNMVTKRSDNQTICGNSIHTICASCKMKSNDNVCPMCRSHMLSQPRYQAFYLKVYSKGTSMGKKLTYQDELDVFYEDELNRPRHLTK